VHRAIAGASEFLEGLFGIGSGGVNVNAYAKDGAEGVEVGGSVGSVRRKGGREEKGWVQELLNVAVEKLCLPLKVRLCVCIPSEIDWNDRMMNDDDRHACRRYARRKAAPDCEPSPVFLQCSQ
jgi:hypothetical protein